MFMDWISTSMNKNVLLSTLPTMLKRYFSYLFTYLPASELDFVSFCRNAKVTINLMICISNQKYSRTTGFDLQKFNQEEACLNINPKQTSTVTESVYDSNQIKHKAAPEVGFGIVSCDKKRISTDWIDDCSDKILCLIIIVH